MPLTSIRTSEDGIVRPESCVVGERGRDVVVRGSHLGLCGNAAVYHELGFAL